MQLTLHSDYSFRILIYLASQREELTTIDEISSAYDISRHHLAQIVHKLGELGFIETIRGKGGGIRLALLPEEVNLGEVLKKMEPNFNIVECFNKKENTCKIHSVCKLKSLLNEAMLSFLSIFENKTLADILLTPKKLKK